ncbi:hypothetical protein [Streptomyces sp. NTH33]|nr:hypothetical protein [Streptomyces sp. NTH33]
MRPVQHPYKPPYNKGAGEPPRPYDKRDVRPTYLVSGTPTRPR